MGKYKPEKIRQRRKELGLTQAQLACKIKTPRPYITALEQGKVEPRISMLIKLATALGVKESYFFEEET